ncbi:MAG: hypothetical protein CMJ18_05935 [Phycisphaeraceae bacterium]|nr:hypothetical protein [Phycisphaeraceae bacterium]
MARFQLVGGDLIMSCSGTIGKIAIVPDDATPGVINQALLKIRPDHSTVRSRFLAAYLRSPSFLKAVARLSMGSAMANVASVRLLEKLPCPVPGIAEQDTMVAALDEQSNRLAGVAARRERAVEIKRLLFATTAEGA